MWQTTTDEATKRNLLKKFKHVSKAKKQRVDGGMGLVYQTHTLVQFTKLIGTNFQILW
jgi:hypothetical protein